MIDRQFPPELLLLPVVLIVARQAIGRQPIFRIEFVVEDFILLLTLIGGLAPSRFKPLNWLVISCLMSVTMTLITWTSKTGKFSVVVFALLAIYNAVIALIELSKLRSDRLSVRS